MCFGQLNRANALSQSASTETRDTASPIKLVIIAQPISPLSRQVLNGEVIGLDAYLLMQPIGIERLGNGHSRSTYY